jgi:N6-L-threonylcarbamoyladenine synthase/protein kinase Bud32
LDIAVGNLLDVFARKVNLHQEPGIPYGAIVERLATQGGEFIFLPYTVKGMDLSFSGLLTASVQLYQKAECRIEDLCFSLQEVAFSMLTEVTERALAHTEKSEILLTGGVAANKRLQEMLKEVAEEHEVKLHIVPKEYALDNGVMIAWTGILSFQHELTLPIDRSQVRMKWRLEDVPAPWSRENPC